jgi:type IV secretory pathway ATPase VirB11/archaellum biosynthesis ATPase/intein/homing endonuclease
VVFRRVKKLKRVLRAIGEEVPKPKGPVPSGRAPKLLKPAEVEEGRPPEVKEPQKLEEVEVPRPAERPVETAEEAAPEAEAPRPVEAPKPEVPEPVEGPTAEEVSEAERPEREREGPEETLAEVSISEALATDSALEELRRKFEARPEFRPPRERKPAERPTVRRAISKPAKKPKAARVKKPMPRRVRKPSVKKLRTKKGARVVKGREGKGRPAKTLAAREGTVAAPKPIQGRLKMAARPAEPKPRLAKPVKPSGLAEGTAAPAPAAKAAEVRELPLQAIASDFALEELRRKFEAKREAEALKEFEEFTTFELPKGYRELERYWIVKPYSWAAILFNEEKNERLYYLVEPTLTPLEKTVLETLHEHLLDRLTYEETTKDRDAVIRDKAMELLEEYGISLDEKSVNKIIYYLRRNYVGYGKIDGLLKDPRIEDISCDGVDVPIFLYHRDHQNIRTNIVFEDAQELDLFVVRLVERAGRQISLGRPTVDAALPEGYRLQATIGTEITTRGSSFSIRKYTEEPFTPVDLILHGTFSPEMLAYLWLATENKRNIMVVGGTASGKCVAGDTKVLLANSRLEEVRSLAEEAFKKGQAVETEDGWLVSDVDLKVFSMGPDLKIAPAKVSKVWKRRSPDALYRVKTRTGREIVTTPEHPFFVIDGGWVLEKRADELRRGAFIAIPRRIAYEGDAIDLGGIRPRLGALVSEGEDYFIVKSPRGRPVRIPKQTTPELLEVVGYVLADGHIKKDGSQVQFHNSNEVLLERFRDLIERVFGLSVKVRHSRRRVAYAEVGSKILSKFLYEAFGIPYGKKADKIDISPILGTSSNECRAFLRAIFDCESHVHVKKGTIEFTSASEAFVRQVELLLSRFGIITGVRKRTVKGKPYWRLLVGGGEENLKNFEKEVGYLHSRKREDLKRAIKSIHSTNFDIVPISNLISTLKEQLNLSDKEIAEIAGMKGRTIGSYGLWRRGITRPALLRLASSLERKYGRERDPHLKVVIEKLAQLATSDVLWDEVVGLERVRPKEPWVYDLTVDSTHNFVANGIIAHNTCTLNALSLFIPPDAKIISIEDTRELTLYQDNWLASVTRDVHGERAIDMYDLLRQALRQRPEVIIVGEVRGKEALTLFQAMSTGHSCYSTMHAGSIQEMVHRLEGEPINVPHHMLTALDIVCLQLLTYHRDRRVRRNQSIVEVLGVDPVSGALRTNRIYERNPITDEFERVGNSQVLLEIAHERGWSAVELERELENRKKVLEYLARNNMRRISEVSAIIRQYYFEPAKVMELVERGGR